MYRRFRKVLNRLVMVYRCRRLGIRKPPKNIKIGKGVIVDKGTRVVFGNNVSIGRGCRFWGDGVIRIGNNSSIDRGASIYASRNGPGIRIGDNCLIAANFYAIDMDHGTQKSSLIRNQSNTIGFISIANDVWIGANVTVIKNTNIREGVIIGACALCKGDTEPYCIYGGVPFRKIGERKDKNQ